MISLMKIKLVILVLLVRHGLAHLLIKIRMILLLENGLGKIKELQEKLKELQKKQKRKEKKYLKNIMIVLMEIKKVFGAN